jgi:hypothetical protein
LQIAYSSIYNLQFTIIKEGYATNRRAAGNLRPARALRGGDDLNTKHHRS